MPSMTHSLAFNLLFLASSTPLVMMPALLAMQTRHDARVLIVVGNLILWGGIYLSLRPMVGAAVGSGVAGLLMGFPLQPGVLGSLIGWLVLLRFAIRPAKPAKLEVADQSSGAGGDT
jgi:hypothetical protein